MNDIDFQEIILSGYADPISKNNLKSYFVSEFKKAERDNFFDAKLFFSGCLIVMKIIENSLEEKTFEQKQLLEERRLLYNKLIELKNEDNLDSFKKELKNLDFLNTLDKCNVGINASSIFNCSISLDSLSNKYSGNLRGVEFIQLKRNIYSAFYEVSPEECMESVKKDQIEHMPEEIAQYFKNSFDEIFQKHSNTYKENLERSDEIINLFESDSQISLEVRKYLARLSVRKIATKEDAELYDVRESEEFSIIPMAESKKEVFERMINLYAKEQFQSIETEFNSKYGEGTERIINDELDVIFKEIAEADTISTTITFDQNLCIPDLEYSRALKYEYSRLENGFYKNKPYRKRSYSDEDKIEILPQQVNDFFTPTYTAKAYARYFLYKKWLESKRDKFQVPDTKYDYELLVDGLKQYFKTSVPNLRSIVDYKKTRNGAKVDWNGKASDAWWFGHLIWKDDFTESYFNKCFKMKNYERDLKRSDMPGNLMNSKNKLKTILENILK